MSQVSFVIGLGSSWSQALLAKRPSQIVGSGRKSHGRRRGPSARRDLGAVRSARRPLRRRPPCRDRPRRHRRQSRSKPPTAVPGRPALAPPTHRSRVPRSRLADSVARRSRPAAVSRCVDQIVADDVVARRVRPVRAEPRGARWPSCRRRAARSAAAGWSPCRRRRGRRPSSRARGPPGGASGRAPRSRPRRGRGGRAAAPSPAPRRSRGRPAPCRPGCTPSSISSISTRPAFMSAHQLGERLQWSTGSASTGSRVDDRRADVAERLVDARGRAPGRRATGTRRRPPGEAPRCAGGPRPPPAPILARRRPPGAAPAPPAHAERLRERRARRPRPRPARAAGGGRPRVECSSGTLSTA